MSGPRAQSFTSRALDLEVTKAFAALTKAVGGSEGLEEVLERGLDLAVILTGARTAVAWQWNAKDRRLEAACCRGIELEDLAPALRWSIQDPDWFGGDASSRKLHAGDREPDDWLLGCGKGIEIGAIVPMIEEDERFGAIAVLNYAPFFDPLESLDQVGRQVASNLSLKRKLEDAERTTRQMNDILASVSHEVRTPLTTVKGFVKMVMDDRYGLTFDESRQYLKIVDGQVDRLIRFLDELLEASRLEGGRIRIISQELDLAREVEDVVKLLISKYPDREVVSDVPEDLCFSSDGDRLAQILLNLLDNALKYSDPGSAVSIQATREPGKIAIAVSNLGSDLSIEELDRVFRKFERLDRHRAELPGNGLGLYITRALVELLGGRIDAASTQGVTVFEVKLPFSEDAK